MLYKLHTSLHALLNRSIVMSQRHTHINFNSMHPVQGQLVTPFARARHSNFMLIHVTAPNLCSAPMATPLSKGVPLEPCGMKHHLPAHLAPAPAHRYVCNLFLFKQSFVHAVQT